MTKIIARLIVLVSSCLLTIVGFAFAFPTLLFFSLWLTQIRKAPATSEELKLFLVITVMIALAALCFASTRHLVRRKTWARYTSIALGALFMCLGSLIIYDALHTPPQSQKDEDFGATFIGLPLIAAGLWLISFLNLPFLRREFKPAGDIPASVSTETSS